jgi:hypothetical protein
VLADSLGVAKAPDRSDVSDGAVAVGTGSRLRYSLPYFPERDYSISVWFCPTEMPFSGIRQVFSAWCRGGDDPLRLTIEGREVSARIEGGGAWRTPGATLENGKWVHAAAVKCGTKLTLYLDGGPVGSVDVPAIVRSMSTDAGIGFNPLYSGGEHFIGRISDLTLFERALTTEEIAAAARR